MNDIEKRIAAIEARNKRVEMDKAWETSWTRRLAIAVMTYGVIVFYLYFIHNNSPLINGAVPVAGFIISTLVLKSVKDFWQSRE